MPYSITCSTKILTLAIALFLFILVESSVNLLWCQVCTFYFPHRKKRYTIVPRGIDVHIQQQIHQKDLNLCPTSYYYAKVIVELEKNTNKEFSCVMVFIMTPSSTLKSQFVFGFNECL